MIAKNGQRLMKVVARTRTEENGVACDLQPVGGYVELIQLETPSLPHPRGG